MFDSICGHNCLNSSDRNCGLLSDINRSGIPNLENISLSTEIVRTAVVHDMILTSGHLEWASVTKKNIFPRNGPRKSTWILCHGAVDQAHG